ncbi:hypothetical protein Ahy_B10g106455 isoform A [Arachis hypogaea]|uniref:Uncharacterized protein n=1 Tax=Arachis hypogaea TaxID=3818 RepID=A0A444XBI4_ARAHY|nr:hypothetical protein Ahy_B10g106455 isoform A [Arachis hypogaea]
MKKLKCLRALNLSFNSMTQLPKSIDKVKHLRYLDLSYSLKLRSLPESIGNLVCLQTLKLKGCKSLVSLPESIGNLGCLQTLNLTFCESLVSLPESVGNLNYLHTLILTFCNKLVFPTKIITKLINLKELDIEGCKAFEDGMPVGLGKLLSLQSLSSFVVGNNKKDTSGKLNELKELVDLRGKLTIRNLGLVKDAASESNETNMRSKKHIQDLSLLWGIRCSDSSEYEIRKSESLVLLDNLCPHQNLRSLHLEGFPGVRFSDWLISLINVVRIFLWDLPNCKHLPPLERLPCLRVLKVDHMGSLEWMDYYENIGDVFFPSLEELVINYCNNLRGWQKNANETQNHLSLPPFPRLSYLRIDNCPKLTCMPSFPHLVELELGGGNSVKLMLETCMVKHDSSFISPLSHLKHLWLREVTGIEAMAVDWMKNLTSLQSLDLSRSSAIQILSRHLQYLPSQLQELKISFNDDKLDLWKHTQGRDPPHALSSLQTIIFSRCRDMKALPEQIGNLQSLRVLEIRYCPKLESLDEADRCLTNIHTLRICGCPILKRKYDPDRDSCKSFSSWHTFKFQYADICCFNGKIQILGLIIPFCKMLNPQDDYFQKKYQRWIKRNVAGIELLDLLLVWNTSDVITSLNLVGASFQSLQYLSRKKRNLPFKQEHYLASCDNDYLTRLFSFTSSSNGSTMYLNHVTNINDISIRSRPNPNPFAIRFSLHFKATNIILSKNG